MRRVFVIAVAGTLSAAVMLSACKKEEAPKTAEQAHEQKMLERSFSESKKAVAAKVNGADITEFAVFREMNTLRQQFLQAGQKPSAELDAKIRKDALDVLVTQELAVQEAGKKGMKVQPQVVDDAVAKMKKDAGSEEAYRKRLAENGLTEDELRAMIGRDALFEMIATSEVDSKIAIADAAVRARYEKERASMKDSAHKNVTYEAAKGLLEQQMRAEAAEKRMAQWEKDLRKNASIEIIGKK